MARNRRALGNLRLGALSGTLCLLLMGCAAEPYLQPEKRSGAVGKTRAAVLQEFGEPDEVYQEDGEEYLSYVFRQSVPYGYYNAFTKTYTTAGYQSYYCRVTFLLVEDVVVKDYAVGPNCG